MAGNFLPRAGVGKNGFQIEIQLGGLLFAHLAYLLDNIIFHSSPRDDEAAGLGDVEDASGRNDGALHSSESISGPVDIRCCVKPWRASGRKSYSSPTARIASALSDGLR